MTAGYTPDEWETIKTAGVAWCSETMFDNICAEAELLESQLAAVTAMLDAVVLGWQQKDDIVGPMHRAIAFLSDLHSRAPKE